MPRGLRPWSAASCFLVRRTTPPSSELVLATWICFAKPFGPPSESTSLRSTDASHLWRSVVATETSFLRSSFTGLMLFCVSFHSSRYTCQSFRLSFFQSSFLPCVAPSISLDVAFSLPCHSIGRISGLRSSALLIHQSHSISSFTSCCSIFCGVV